MQNLHRNKRSLTLNLKRPEGRQVFLRLVETADVVVENYRPDVKERLGLSYETLRSANRRIILCSISGFGQTGPYRDRAGFDQIAQGMGGLMGVTGEPERGPMRAGIAIADSSAGIFGATGILVALAERERSGEGQWVQTSLLQAQIAMCDFQAALYLVDGTVPGQAGNDHPYSTPMGVVETRDGFINIGVGGDGQWRSFCEAIERPDLAETPDFASGEGRFRHRPELRSILEGIMRARSSADWLARFERHGVPAGPIYRMDEVFADPQVHHLGMAAPLSHAERGDIAVVAQPITLSRTPAAVVSPIPEPGEHTDEILAGAGFATDAIARLRRSGVI